MIKFFTFKNFLHRLLPPNNQPKLWILIPMCFPDSSHRNRNRNLVMGCSPKFAASSDFGRQMTPRRPVLSRCVAVALSVLCWVSECEITRVSFRAVLVAFSLKRRASAFTDYNCDDRCLQSSARWVVAGEFRQRWVSLVTIFFSNIFGVGYLITVDGEFRGDFKCVGKSGF